MDANNITLVDCSDLSTFQAFEDYISTLRKLTTFNETLLEQCRSSICGALWGYGVPDISGIGVAVGYLLGIILGPLLSFLLLLTLSSSTSHPHVRIARVIIANLPRRVSRRLPTRSKLQSVLAAGLLAFFESAIYFALAIEIATIAILAPKDYESQAVAFGDYDARTCSLVSTICLLPLLYPVAVLSFLSSTADDIGHQRDAPPTPEAPSTAAAGPKSEPCTRDCADSPANPVPKLLSTTTPHTPEENPQMEQITERNSHRLTLFSLCTLLSIYPFLSQSFRTWAPTQVGTGNGPDGETIVDDVEWSSLGTTGFTEVKTLTNTEHVVLGIFQTAGSCVVLLFGLGVLLPRGLSVLEWYLTHPSTTREDEGEGVEGGRHVVVNPDGETTTVLMMVEKMIKLCNAVKTKCRCSAAVRTFLLAIPVSLAAPLLWGFWRLRGLQAELASATGGRDEGGDWSFGQVVAITIFLPVGVEMVFTALSDHGHRHGQGHGQAGAS